MKTNIEHFSPLDSEQLIEVNGGGFAYDVGRVLRFIGIAYSSNLGPTAAIVDWQVNALVNKY